MQKNIAFLLCILPLIVFQPTLSYSIVNYDREDAIPPDNVRQGEFSSDNLPYTQLGLLILFRDKIPSLEEFQPYLIHKYSAFPILQMNFPTQSITQDFFSSFHQNIVSIESNKAFHAGTSLFQSIQGRPKLNFQRRKILTDIRDSTGASTLHLMNLTGKGVKIGIIDTGVNIGSEFGTRVIDRAVFVTQLFGYSMNITDVNDRYTHGTQVATFAAGSSIGIAPDAEIYSAKIFHNSSTLGAGGGGGEETTAGMLEAIEWLVNNSVDIINLSMGQYHNLPTGLRDRVINQMAIEESIVFTISAGNSGTGLGDRGTLNNPATALQAIAVTASDIDGTFTANFASKGPKVDYSMKPDIAAPGVGLPGQGTSFAAPMVAGAAALLIEGLRNASLSYSAATIKAALLAGARSMGFSPWKEGAGFLNVTSAWEKLISAPLENNRPELVYLHPQQLPYDPFEVLFPGSSVSFNLTVITGVEQVISGNFISPNLSPYVHLQGIPTLINNSFLLPLNFTIPLTAEEQIVEGTLTIGSQTLPIIFEIRNTQTRILFDETLNRIAHHGIGTKADEIQGDTSSTIGMFSEFTRYLAYDNNFSVTPHTQGDLTFSKLSKFDVLILPNPFSLASDRYMDWVSNPGETYVVPSPQTITAIHQFVSEGGGLLVLSTDHGTYNLTALNEFLIPFDIQIQRNSSGIISQAAIIDNSLDFTQTIDSYPHWGNYLSTIGNSNNTQVVATLNDEPTLVAHLSPTGGRVMVFGSDLIFDNVGFSSYAYQGDQEKNRILAFNAVAWLSQGVFRTTPANIPEFPLPLMVIVLFSAIAICYIVFTKKFNRR